MCTTPENTQLLVFGISARSAFPTWFRIAWATSFHMATPTSFVPQSSKNLRSDAGKMQ